jgi:hypothetical protein
LRVSIRDCGRPANTPRGRKLRNRLIGLVKWMSGPATLMAVLALAVSARAQAQKPAVLTKTQTTSAKDFSGVWMERQESIAFSAHEPPLLPWAMEKFKTAKPGYGPRATPDSQDPILKCLPPGVPRIMLIPFPIQIVQTPGEVIMLFEYDHYIRHIFLDRREHPQNPDLTWMGDSIGHWEGDTLVVDTIGLNDKTWLDQVGHPHSDSLHVIERIRRVNHDTLQDDLTIDDPRAYAKPWTGQQVFKLKPAWRLSEYVCEDNQAREAAGR